MKRFGSCLGVPVYYDPNFYAIAVYLHSRRWWWPWRFKRVNGFCQARGLWRKKIVVGSLFDGFSTREKQAILLHEVGHVKLRHIEQRIRSLWMVLFRPSAFADLCVRQELQADRFSAECGYGSDLAMALSHLQQDKDAVLHPASADRIARLLACSKG